MLRSLLAVLVLAGLTGCGSGPRILPREERKVIDRKLIERPSGFDVELFAVGLDQPIATTFDGDGNLIIAEAGMNRCEPRIYGFTPDARRFDIYPFAKPLVPFLRKGTRLYGPVGGILVHNSTVYVSHRDENDFGVISALDYKGGIKTIVSGLPAQGENGVTDLAIDNRSGRLYFGVGSATNSGVVGIDDHQIGWPKHHPAFHDVFYTPDKPMKLLGRRFDSRNPAALWLMPDIAVTAPFQAFGQSTNTLISGATRESPKCNSAIFSVMPDGGDLRVEAHGIRLPRGLAFNEFGTLYFTNQGMELRGTRPVKDDPDVLARLFPGAWYGAFDFSTDLQPISNPRFQPPLKSILPTGYPDLSFLINHAESGLVAPDDRFAKNAILGVMPSQSGAAGMEFAPPDGPFRQFAGSAIVALSGDRWPFSASGEKLKGSIGFKLVRVDVDRAQVRDFVRNVQDGPSSRQGGGDQLLERPVDVKFGPDGALYILDLGEMEVVDGQVKSRSNTGRIYRVIPSREAATRGP
ncbi:PQQ-dependent sugar dehydrogenase [Humisphaera borealis]|uniref:Glucose/Sorbosone dehydrogenase domain-containing protein n=1 Tax=Humisphaera borealis TaxID=2807512 RepID=A0A7M2WS25_9BACT|nr:hypothetical protein [Humisphaera borealis]QOV88317.1 hypothetical protein IPV69_18985 [Humisphaera borealis]